MCCMRLSENTGHKNDVKNRHLGTIAQFCLAISSQLKHESTIRKKLVNSNVSSTCAHNMANFSPITAEICWRVWGTPANFNGFRVLPSLLQRHRSPEANQTLHDVWPSSWLLHYIDFWRLLPSDRILPGAKFILHPTLCILVYWQGYCTALQQRLSAKLCSVVPGMELQNSCSGCHLYSTGRSSHWASAHISRYSSIVVTFFLMKNFN